MTQNLTETTEVTMVSEEGASNEVNPNSFTIKNLAITMLNLEKSTTEDTDKCIKLEEEKHLVFFNFFKEHIEQTRSGKRTRQCKFLDSDNAVLAKINRYLEDQSDDSFLDFTNRLTKSLFEIMKSATKSSGSFFVLHAIYNEEEFIILLKLDPKDGVQLTDSLDLKKIENMLPESGDRVHKCALIKTNYTEGDTNLFVLDRQQKAGESSKFFMETFLQSIATPNDNMKTINSMREIKEYIARKSPDLDKKKVEDAINTEFSNGATVHLPDAVENIYNKVVAEDQEDREIYVEQCKSDFVSAYTTKYKNYGLSLVVDRNEDKVFYTSQSKQIYFKYDKSLDNNEVTIDHDIEEDIYTVTIKNTDEIGFGQDIR